MNGKINFEEFFNLSIRLNNTLLNSTIGNGGGVIGLDCSSSYGPSGCIRNLSSSNGNISSIEDDLEKPEKVYWALPLVLLPILAIFGNILVILSVYKEKSLQSVTNYFIVSLAFADLFVACVVMPFAVYFLVSQNNFFTLHFLLTFSLFSQLIFFIFSFPVGSKSKVN